MSRKNMPEAEGEGPYGHHDEKTGEYVITRPDTPTPWINYIGGDKYGGIISNTAGGYSFYRDPRHRRITRYRYNSIPADQPGRYIYIRDMGEEEYWSPTWQPVKKPLDSYECRHGPGYTRINSTKNGIETEVLYFVPLEDNCELWSLKLRNTTSTSRDLQIFSYIEFSFPKALQDLINIDWTGQVMRGREEEGVLRAVSPVPRKNPLNYYFTSNAPVAGYDTDREEFVGPYRDLSNPVVVEDGESKCSIANRGNVIGSLSHNINLEPGEERRIVFILGSEEEEGSDSDQIIAKYRDPATVDEAFDNLLDDWKEFSSVVSVDTPDANMNAMLNTWNLIQNRTTLNWSRFASAYQTGISRGFGTRDSSQDGLGVVHTVPQRVRDTLEMLWKLQFRDGHAWHIVYPLTGEGGPGQSGEENYPEAPLWFSDDHLWLVVTTCHYLKETGDYDFLDEKIPYQDGEEETVWDHIKRAIKFTDNHRGVHELPRMGFSDWNDTLNIDRGSGKAASVWTAMLFCYVLKNLINLCEYLGKEEEAINHRNLREEMTSLVNEHGWDGDRYLRAYDDEGEPIGSKNNTYQQISLNPQTWSVISGIADEERAEKAMETAHRRLNTNRGFALMDPPYDGYNPRIGGTTTYPPGAKENGGIFSHAHAWSIVAAALLDKPDRAYTYYKQILPLEYNDVADLYKTEPYVYCQNILGPEHPGFGRGFNSWLTGTAAWTYIGGTQYILGIRPTYSGLKISPCMPKDWSGFKVKRQFRGSTYNIEVKNPRNASSEIKQLKVDGESIEGNILPIFEDGAEHKVLVVMGER